MRNAECGMWNDSPAAARHPLREGEACRTQEMRLIGKIGLIKLIGQ